jgi:Mycobacterium 19 kDa lipoprotein antigen
MQPRDTAGMRSVGLTAAGQPVLAASAALLLVTLVGCSSNRGSPGVTTVVFDGQTYTISGQVSCVKQSDGKLLINAAEGGKKLIRVRLGQENRLVVEAAGFRFLAVGGFTDDSNEAWAAKADNTYTISRRMPPDDGQTAGHQFKIEVTCAQVEEFRPRPPPPPMPRIPRA